MAVTLVETVGSASANTYVTATEAQAYFEGRMGGEKWPSANANLINSALLTAMRLLESLSFIGGRNDSTQALNWPRVAIRPNERMPPVGLGYGIYGGGLYDARGRSFLATAIPQPIKDAQCEIAYAMVLDPSLNDPILIQSALRAGNITIDHRQPASTRLRMGYECLSGLVLQGTSLARA